MGADMVRHVHHIVGRCRHIGLVLCWVRLGKTHMLACTKRLGVGADTVSRCGHVGLVLFLVKLGQTHMLACATRLGIGADMWGWSYFWLG